MTPQLENLDSLITYKDGEADRCLGYLLSSEGHGVYDSTFGKVDVTPEQAAIHNSELDLASLKGLDENCAIGQGGTFYLTSKDGSAVVLTFIGTLVSSDCTREDDSITFRRGGKTFYSRAPEEGHAFNFRRIA